MWPNPQETLMENFICCAVQFSFSGLQKLFLSQKILINIYGKTDTEKVDLGRL